MSWFALILTWLVVLGAVALISFRRRLPARAWALLWAAPLLGVLVVALIARLDGPTRSLVLALAMPSGLLWLALGACAAWPWCQRQRPAAICLTAVWIGYALAGNAWLGGAAVARLERDLPRDDPFAAAGAPFEAVLVLGGGVVRGPGGRAQLGHSGDRAMLAAALQRAGRTEVLIASGIFAPDTVALWRRLGIPATAMLTQRECIDTSQEIAAFRRLIAERGWTRVGLVGSAWHLPRALMLCRRQGIAPILLPCNWEGGGWPWSASAVVPQADGFRKVGLVWKESLGLLFDR